MTCTPSSITSLESSSAKGARGTPNVLSGEEILNLFNEDLLSTATYTGCQARLVLAIGVLTGMYPSSLEFLSVVQIRRDSYRGQKNLLISGAVDSSSEDSKIMPGGLKSIGRWNGPFPLWHQPARSELPSILEMHGSMQELVSQDRLHLLQC